MPSEAVVLYGPPASGKDTVTAALLHLPNRQYIHFKKLKVGRGSQTGYHRVSEQTLHKLQQANSIQQLSVRYGNKYAVDRPQLAEVLAAGKTPVVHMGDLAGVRQLLAYPAAWLCVLLWCDRDETRRRLIARRSANLADRLGAWDASYTEVVSSESLMFNAAIRTDLQTSDSAAHEVDVAVISESNPKVLSRQEILRIINEAPADTARANIARQ